MPDAAGRLDQLRHEAEAAVRSAATTAELEELRVRYLGRKSELTGMLRSIGELPPEQRGPVGQANSVAPRSRHCSPSAPGASRPRSWTRSWRATGST